MMEIDPAVEDGLTPKALLWELTTVVIPDEPKGRFDRFRTEGPARPGNMD